MTLGNIKAAGIAIATHTAVLGIDDDGSPAEVGMWHLLHSLMDYSAARGLDFDAPLAASKEALASRPDRLYLVRVEDPPGECTVAVAHTEYQFEVSAASVREACLLVINGPRRHSDVRPRQTHRAYTGEYIEPDHERYAAAAEVRMRRPEDIENGVKRALASGFAPRMAAPAVSVTPGNGFVAAAARSLLAFRGDDDADVMLADLVPHVLKSLAEYAEKSGVDFDEMVADVRCERESPLKPA